MSPGCFLLATQGHSPGAGREAARRATPTRHGRKSTTEHTYAGGCPLHRRDSNAAAHEFLLYWPSTRNLIDAKAQADRNDEQPSMEARGVHGLHRSSMLVPITVPYWAT